VRDIGSGLIVLALLALRRPRVLGWVMLAASVIPIGDALIVLAHGGPAYAAYGIHGATAVAAIVAAIALIRGRAGQPALRGSAAPVH
jgi:predicted PurR-regulated permease PerM